VAGQPDLGALARAIVEDNRFMTLGTADEDGVPWVSPVWFAPATSRELLWASSPDAQHSRNLATRPEVAVVIFDSHRVGAWNGLYMAGVAEELRDVDAAIATYSRRSEAQGFRAWTPGDVLPPARHRLYRVSIAEQFVLDDHDVRLPVELD
jgi:nitroimidazol reductase NimA-like FMN-containing flavoprotein (pyridoxamine 5'-phosphate oxidase superfamily)